MPQYNALSTELAEIKKAMPQYNALSTELAEIKKAISNL
jgi:hypothetical protein